MARIPLDGRRKLSRHRGNDTLSHPCRAGIGPHVEADAIVRNRQHKFVVARHEDKKLVEIAEPFGPVAAIIPSTNPTSTALYKILISVKARCSIVLSPHPAAVKCISAAAQLMDEAARRAGAPAGTITWMTDVTLEGTQELMKQREIAVILATGGMGLVRAAYSAGKPAYGVGPGNAPAGNRKPGGVTCSQQHSRTGSPTVERRRSQISASGVLNDISF